MNNNNFLYHNISNWFRKQDHIKLKTVQFLCALYIVVMIFSYPPVGIRDPETNTIIDPNSQENTENGYIYLNGSYRAVVASNTWQMICYLGLVHFLCIR